MDAAKDFDRTLSELEELVNRYEIEESIREKLEEVRQNWVHFSNQHSKLIAEVAGLTRPKVKGEGLKLIITANSSPTTLEKPIGASNHHQYQSYENENLFIRRTTHIHHQHSQQEHGSSISTSPTLTIMSPPLTLSVNASEPPSTGPEGTKVMEIVRRMSGVSTGSSSPSTPSPNNSPDFITTSKTIRQRGTEKKYQYFQEIFPSPILDSVTYFVLNFIQVETGTLFDTFERCCPNIKHIELNSVIFIGPFNRRVQLPQLKNFLLNRITSLQKRNCEARNLSLEDFQNLLFFARWEDEDPIPPQVIRMELVIDGWTQFKINYESGEFVSRLPFANDILHRLTSRFKMRKFTLQACKFQYAGDEVYENLSYLNFQSILTSSQDLIKVLSHCPNLQELRFKNYIDGVGIYLKDLPTEKLKFLCLGLCTYTLSVKYSPGVCFENLDTLVFPTNIMDDETLENIPSIFKTKKVIVYLCSQGVRCKNAYYILSKLLQIEGIEWIWMSNFRRSLPGCDYFDPVQLKLRDDYEEFLFSSGLHCPSSTDIILEKKSVSNEPGSTWIGREVTKEEHQVLEFQNRDGYKFSTWEAYMRRY